MQKVISINEFEKTVNSIDDIEEPIIIKRENKEDLVVISLAEYKKSLFLTELSHPAPLLLLQCIQSENTRSSISHILLVTADADSITVFQNGFFAVL